MLNWGTSIGLNDNEFHKERFDNALDSKDYDGCQAAIFEFIDPPPIMVSGSIFPDYDFEGGLIQDLMDFN